MSRMERVKDALAKTLYEVESNIKTIHQGGGTAPREMIGFRNGLALADHHINLRFGEAKMIDLDPRRIARIENMKPAVEVPAADEQEYEYLVDQILSQARAVCWTPEGEEREKEVRVLGKKFLALDEFIAAKMGEAGSSEASNPSDAGVPSQDGATPPPAPSTPNPEA